MGKKHIGEGEMVKGIGSRKWPEMIQNRCESSKASVSILRLNNVYRGLKKA